MHNAHGKVEREVFNIVERRNFWAFPIERYPTLTENTRPSGERTSLRFSKSARLKWMEHGDIRGSGYETSKQPVLGRHCGLVQVASGATT